MTPLQRRALGGVALLALIAAGTVVARLAVTREWTERLVGAAGALTAEHWLLFGGAQVAVAALGVLPASVIAVAAGAAYGMVWGLLLSAGCTMFGGWLGFLLARSMLRPWIARLMRRRAAFARFDEVVAEDGWRSVCLLRVSPVMPFAATSFALGLTGIDQRAFLLGTLASLPALAGYVAMGAFGRAGLALGWQAAPLQWALLAAGVAAVLLAVWRLKRMAERVAAA